MGVFFCTIDLKERVMYVMQTGVHKHAAVHGGMKKRLALACLLEVSHCGWQPRDGLVSIACLRPLCVIVNPLSLFYHLLQVVQPALTWQPGDGQPKAFYVQLTSIPDTLLLELHSPVGGVILPRAAAAEVQVESPIWTVQTTQVRGAAVADGGLVR